MIFNPDGNAFDGSCNSIVIGSSVIPALKASYADKLDKGTVTSMGTQGIDAVTRGTYSVDDAKITFRSEIARKYLFPLFPATGAGNVPYMILVSKVHPELGDDSDLLVNCYIVGLGATIENSNKADEIETTWKIGKGIQWMDRRLKIYDDGQAGSPSGISISAGISFNF